MKLFYSKYMELAINYAKESLRQQDEVPVGCIIIDNKKDKILSMAKNEMITTNDPTAHAEIIAIRKACQVQNNYRLSNTSLFTTLEPCLMCFEAIKIARIEHIYFGSYSNKNTITSNKINIIGGFYETECNHIIDSFFANKRLNV